MNMPRDEAIRVLQSGRVREWNLRRDPSDWLPDLASAELSGAYLARGDFVGAGFEGANFARAQLGYADLREAHLKGANFVQAQLVGANLAGADLRDADLRGSTLDEANLSGARLSGVNLSEARVGRTLFTGVDLSAVNGLDRILFFGPCSIDRAAFEASDGHIPPSFLLGCGLDPWELPLVRLYSCALDKQSVSALMDAAHRLKAGHSLILISYAHEDSSLVDRLYQALVNEAHVVWMDRRDSTGGDIETQVRDRIEAADAVIIVLSQHSLASTWVEIELQIALDLENTRDQQILCPISVDDSWQSKIAGPWQAVSRKTVLDFSVWGEDAAFDSGFQRLSKGLRTFFGKQPRAV
ncbi:MAG: toll/interleukin-1 receptor domain-containing protein [Planctomycetota bacterium]